jgi:predicted ATPase/DNA-binding NarL/FixJ family response regulator
MRTPNNLPAELSSFVGRERQLAELRRLLRRTRLITLTGPGGAGKTRLALHLAADILNHYPDGVWLVELAPLADARLLDQTVSTACRITEKRKRPPVEALIEGLASRKVLLVLDGCEHMVDFCATLASRLLRSCPDLTVLVTSREPLGVPGELIWRTPSLSVPAPEDSSHPELVLASEAVRLYVERAQLVRPGFLLDGSTSSPVAQICARLEGIPLAIELAASLAGMMTQEETLVRLRDRFRLLVGGSRTSLPRHQTLRQAVDWSYGLLSAGEKVLFTRLAYFASGFDIEAAEAVAPPTSSESEGVLRVLSRLVDKSLVVAESVDPKRTRYRLLDTIREYALEKLQETDVADIRALHTRYYVTWCARAREQLRGGDQVEWLGRLDEELPNVRLALGWAVIEQPDDALRLAGAMGTYWLMRHQSAEGMRWLDLVLEHPTTSLDSRALALLARAQISWRQGELTRPQRDAEECVKLCRSLGLNDLLNGALNSVGLIRSAVGDWEGADLYLGQVLDLARERGDHGGVAMSLNNMALGASARGDNQTAAGMMEEAVEAARMAGNRFVLAQVLDSLARVRLRSGELSAARALYCEAILMSLPVGNLVNVAVCIEGLAVLALADGDPVRTLKLASAAHGLRGTFGSDATPDWIGDLNGAVANASAKLGRQAADAAWQQGMAMNLQEAVDYAIGVGPAAVRTNGTPLTGRETQVARLVADGMTNPEIAKRLRMADRTADAHVEHIRNKLGLRNRSQIAVWAHARLGIAQIKNDRSEQPAR